MFRTSKKLFAFALFCGFSVNGSRLAVACPCEQQLDEAAVYQVLGDLLSAEGFAPTASRPVIALRRVELDGDPQTEEAFVDLIEAELCGPALVCPTLVVLLRGGRLRSAGSGHALVSLQSSQAGYHDLGSRSPSLIPFMPVVTSALHWNGHRYTD